jgi:hypothetical protein
MISSLPASVPAQYWTEQKVVKLAYQVVQTEQGRMVKKLKRAEES